MTDKVLEAVLSYPKLAERITNRPQDRKKVEKVVGEIRGEYNPKLIKTLKTLIDYTFLKLYDGLNLEVPPDMDLLKLAKENHLVLVPNHQSHADYIALTYLLFTHYQLPVYVAGGINLNIFPIGKIFRNSGAFYIRRSFSSDILYRLSFEAYLHYLLDKGEVVEFFFEGGRSRTGKLLPPRFGLFQMLLEAHAVLKDSKPLLFIPVSLAHEVLPEEKAHAKELGGAKKEQESPGQLLKIYKIFNKKLGSLHVRFGRPIEALEFSDIKATTQQLAFDCFRSVGKNMPVTPPALLALILLDEASGAMTWKDIESRASEVINYCQRFNIPLTQSLQGAQASQSLQRALDMLIKNKKVETVVKEKLAQVFYACKEDGRVELLYFKNMILHHFIVPGIMTITWPMIFKGDIKTVSELTKFLIRKRKELKYEFYLPSVKEMLNEAMEVTSFCLGRKIEKLDECVGFTTEEMYQIADKLKCFSMAFCHIYEGYYLGAITLKHLANTPFNQERYLQVARELFELERKHGRVIKYRESYTVPLLKTTLDYFSNLKVIEKVGGKFQVVDFKGAEQLIVRFGDDLYHQVSIGIKLNK